MAKRDRDSWIEDFSLVLTDDAMRQIRGGPRFEVFGGSKPLAVLWLASVGTVAGALGGMLVSGALWRSLVQVPLWLGAMVATWVVVRKATLAVAGQPLGFGSSLFSGVLIGAVAMWGAQLSSAGWAYGIAGGIGFLVGITFGSYEPEDLKGRDSYFTLNMVGAPAGACLGAWLHRHGLLGPPALEAAALAGGIAGIVYLGPVEALFFKRLDNAQGLKRLGSLLLHRDDCVAQAIRLLDTAIRLAPGDASLLDRRALAHALAGDADSAEADWKRHTELAQKSVAPSISRGWVHLRRDRPAEAAAAFAQAANGGRKEPWALVGLGIARLRLGDAAGSIEAFSQVPQAQHDALSLTYLAEAHLAAGDAQSAVGLATDAIDELDSIHGRSWLARAEARRALGDIDGAAKDYNKALWAADEPGTKERAMAGLEAIGRPVVEEDEEDEEE